MENDCLSINGRMVRCERIPEDEKSDGFLFKKEQFPIYKVNKLYNIDKDINIMDIHENDVIMLEDDRGTLIKINEKEFLMPYYKIIAKVVM